MYQRITNDGNVHYVHFAFANSDDGVADFTTSGDAEDYAYVGTYTDETETDSANPSSYTWVASEGTEEAETTGNTTEPLFDRWGEIEDPLQENLISGTNEGSAGWDYTGGTISGTTMQTLQGTVTGVEVTAASGGILTYSIGELVETLAAMPENTYTLSFEINTSTAMTIPVSIADVDGTNTFLVFDDAVTPTDTEGFWTYASTAAVRVADASSQVLLFDMTGITSGTIQIANLKIESGDIATPWTCKPVLPIDLDNTRAELSSSIDQSAAAIISNVSAAYYSKDETDDLISSVNTTITQTAESIEMTFNEFQQQYATDGEAIADQFADIEKYIRFIDGNIILGEEGNELTLTIENDKIVFKQNNTPIAVWENSMFQAVDGEFATSLKLGPFAFIPRPNGNLSFKKVVT